MGERSDLRAYNTENKRKNRLLDKELGIRYRGWEPIPGESFKDFKRRMTAKTTQSAKKYPAWKRAPTESKQEFKKRLTAKRFLF